jgi:hypothetical protein
MKKGFRNQDLKKGNLPLLEMAAFEGICLWYRRKQCTP